jgi:hypothetical protein
MVEPASAVAVDISLGDGHRYPLPGVVALEGRALVNATRSRRFSSRKPQMPPCQWLVCGGAAGMPANLGSDSVAAHHHMM